MLPVLEDPILRAQVHSISVGEYHRMISAGSLPENVELIRGTLIEKMSQSPLHGSIVELLREHVAAKVAADCIVRQEKPLTFEESEPEPDVAVVRGVRSDFLTAHPSSAELIIEVCVSSEAVDRVKLGVYAEAGIPEAWLILAEERLVERHTEPQGTVYQRIERAALPSALGSTVIAELSLPPTGLWPD